MTTQDKIKALRNEMSQKGIDAFIVYSADPHMSEYLPEEWLEREWLSGFMGSAGFVVITKNKDKIKQTGKEIYRNFFPHCISNVFFRVIDSI